MVYTQMEYYSAFKRIVTHVTTWMNLEDVMLSEISRTHIFVTKGQILYDSTYMKYLVKFTQKVEQWLPGLGGNGSGKLLYNG